MAGLIEDVRYSLRLLRRQPAYTLFVVLTLAIGIGANTAVFSAVNGVLLRPLPFHESDRLLAIWGRFDPESGFDFPRFTLSAPEYVDYRTQSRAVSEVAAFTSRFVTVSRPGADPERVSSTPVSASFFPLLRAQPAFGRVITESDDVPNGAAVVVLSHGYWQSRFGGDQSVLGRTIAMNGVPTQVIGVMPASFRYPNPTTELWTPIRIDPKNPGNRKGHNLRAIGRLAPGADLATARAELQSLMQDWKARFPDIHTGHYLFINPLIDDVAGPVRPALLLLLTATGFVLLIVCANIATIVMARGEVRQREMAIRSALGAAGARLLRLSLVENAIIASIAGALGLALGYAGLRLLLTVDPATLPRAGEITLDVRILGFTAFATIVSAALFGLLPAFRSLGADLQQTLRHGAHSASAGVGRQWARTVLVAAEVALTVVLVIGAALMLRSLDRLLSVDLGFDPSGLVTASIAPPAAEYRDPQKLEAFYAALIERLRAAPGVVAASAGTTVPLFSSEGVWDFEIEGRPSPPAGARAWNASATVVRPGYFEALGVHAVRGRLFSEQDDARSATVGVINEAMARTFFATEDPIGRRIRVMGVDSAAGWMTIVGVSADVRASSLAQPPAPAYYFLQSQTPRFDMGPYTTMSVLARTSGSADALLASLRSIVRELDPSVAVFSVQTADAVIQRSVADRRFTSLLLTVFAGIGVLLGASGIYGVLSYIVARRTQEIGIRRALGASRGSVARYVLGGAMRPVVAGLAVGAAASYWTTAYWRTQLFEVSPNDPGVYSSVVLGILVIAVAATLLPVRRALRVNPLVALRSE